MRRYEDGSYYFEDYAPYDREHWTLLLDAIAWLTPLVGSEIAEGTPYGVGGRLACRFIEHALDLAPVVAMLLRVTRTHLFGNCAAFDRKIVLLDRIVWFEREGAAGPSDNHAWYLWNRRHHHGPPAIEYARAALHTATIREELHRYD